MEFEKGRIFLAVVLVLVSSDLCFGSELGMSPAHGDHGHHHHCSHGHDHHHHHHHDHAHHQHRHVEEKVVEKKKMMLPEELAEEEDMKLYGFGPYGVDHDHDYDNQELSGLGLWVHAMGCSLLVSLASLICLIILPVIFIQGKPSKAVVDSLALFGVRFFKPLYFSYPNLICNFYADMYVDCLNHMKTECNQRFL
ncbi:IAA-alanine resistance protein 1 [Corchorus capsularis]|uniref:IAA-alanine resistance protein 1 n=1 Tax=Corchorus capsularis TaxID=210143 RepID=A0A1R3GRU7_COCAP|nr:IAA-alanine resistance protein 1 [Corchorus capsularis]